MIYQQYIAYADAYPGKPDSESAKKSAKSASCSSGKPGKDVVGKVKKADPDFPAVGNDTSDLRYVPARLEEIFNGLGPIMENLDDDRFDELSPEVAGEKLIASVQELNDLLDKIPNPKFLDA